MADSFRLTILKRLTDALKEIAPTNGYTNDLADTVDEDGAPVEHVFRGKDRFGDGDVLPIVSILEHPSALEQLLGTGVSSTSTGEWRLLIQGFVKDDPDNPTDAAHTLAAEVVKRIVQEKTSHDGRNILSFGPSKPCVRSLGGLSYIARPGDGEISDTAYFMMTLTLTLVEDLENPFAFALVSS